MERKMGGQAEKAQSFRNMHVPGTPVVLYNIWDAGSAGAVARCGAKAIATSSWSVAAAQGYADGQEMPLDVLLAVVARITHCVDLPLTVDFEGGYAIDPATIGENVGSLLELGVIGLNLEDQVVKGSGLYSVRDQAERLRAVRSAADDKGISAVINARTDLFLKAAPDVDHADLLEEACVRQIAYANAGADSFFVPGLTNRDLIRRLCERSGLPINVMLMGDLTVVADAARLGVARISFGPAPYRASLANLETRFNACI
jgi:2-methylisocitrate lyase-like PEP mutase family enzyme